MNTYTQTIDGVAYITAPEVEAGSCKGCAAFDDGNTYLCDTITDGMIGSCLNVQAIWVKRDNPCVEIPVPTGFNGTCAADIPKTKEYTGGSVSYYKVKITNPTSGCDAYTAECNDIIEALGMDYAEGNAFKAIWRSCAARNLGISKDGYKDGLYDAEKVVFFGGRMVAKAKSP